MAVPEFLCATLQTSHIPPLKKKKIKANYSKKCQNNIPIKFFSLFPNFLSGKIFKFLSFQDDKVLSL